MKPPRSSQHSRPDSSSDSQKGDFEGDFDPQLWDLLGQAEQPPTISPFFARNVMREIRLAEAQKAERGFLGSLGALAKRWRMIMTGAGAAAIVTIAATLAITSSSQDQPALSTATTATTASYDAEIIAQLDELLDDESIWLDSTVSAH